METPKKKKKEKLLEKQCAFIDEDGTKCKTIFFGTGKSRFCLLHRQPKFRKIIDRDKIIARKQAAIDNTANITIHHKNTEATVIFRNCDVCGETYEIKLYPAVFLYSKYCHAHRNEHKRKRYLESLTNPAT